MKICFLAAANSIHSKKWIEYFANKGFETHWISLVSPTEEIARNIKFYEFKGNFLNDSMRIKKLIKSISPDILHAHYAGKNGFCAVLSNFHPFVLTVWGDDVLFLPHHIIKGYFVRMSLKKADLITCDAEHMRNALIKLGIPLSKIKIIYFGIDTKKFSPQIKDEKLMKELQVFGYKIVISLRNFYPIYNIDILIRAIPLVLKEVPKTKFIIIGSGPEEKMLKKLVESLKISWAVRFIGRVNNDDIPKYLSISDIYVSTALSDAGIAASTAEAMACGVPVIITRSGENEKWIDDNINGFLIPPKNHYILAEKIIYLLRNEEIRLKFASLSREIIEERNNYYKEMAKMEDIYNKLINYER